jgi:hypothetical protein
LSGLLALSTYLAESALKELSDSYAAEMQSTDQIDVTLDKFVKKWAEGIDTNFANKLKLEDETGEVEGENGSILN